LNSDDLRIFLRVAEAGSLSRAATLLGRPKSSVSRQLARLEAEAGAALLERGAGGMRLTDAGRVLLEQAQRVVALTEGAAAAVQAALATPRGMLRANVPHLFATNFLAPRLPDFLRAWPEVDVTLDVSPHAAGAMAREADVVVRVGPLEDSALIARKLGTSALRLYAAPAALAGLSPAAARARLADSDVAEAAPLGQYRSIVSFTGGQPARRVQALEPLVRHGLVMAGAGAAWLPAFLCQAEVAQGRLLDLTPDAGRGPIAIHALYTAEGATSPKVRAFVQFLARIMEALEPPRPA
jgi:DNA-binding transcriptional LysR family regulator